MPTERAWITVAPAADHTTLRCCSWNILEQNLCMGINYHKYVRKCENNAVQILSWHHRLGKIVDEIRKHDPDVIAFQEVNRIMFKDLSDKLSNYKGLQSGRVTGGKWVKEDGKMSTGTAVFYRDSHRLKKLTHRFAPVGPDSEKKKRDAVAVLFEYEGKHVVFACTHPRCESDKKETARQVHALATQVRDEAHLKETRAPIVMCGDFNEGPRSSTFKYLTKNTPRLCDAYMSWEAKAFQKGESRFTFSYRNKQGGGSVIDFMFHSRALEVVRLLQMDRKAVFQGRACIPNAEFPSDHVPLMCDFRWVETGAASSSKDRIAFDPSLSSYWCIVARHSGLALDVQGKSTTNGAVIQQWKGRGANKHFKIVPVGDGSGDFFITARKSGLALDIKDESKESGAELQLWDNSHRGENQRFRFEPVGDGTNHFFIIARHSGLALDVKAKSPKSGAIIQQYHYKTRAMNKQFRLEPASD